VAYILDVSKLCELNYPVRSTLGITVYYYDLISTTVKIRFDFRELQVYIIPIGTKSRMQYFSMSVLTTNYEKRTIFIFYFNVISR